MAIKRDGYNAGGLGDPRLDWYGEPNDNAESEDASEFEFAGIAFYANDGSDVCAECNGSRGAHAFDCQVVN